MMNCRMLIISCLFMSFCLTGCLSHWFLDSESRLQVENATEEFSIIAINVVSQDSSSAKSWIDEILLPQTRSRVVEADFVGDFKFQILYTQSKDATGDTLVDYKDFNLEGGSLYLQIRNKGKSLTYQFK